ncbi:uncharacterized protein SPSK_10141 [Sporothrix schenckii 1099-18]|uniref:Uncharacterized protein n=1 Tax=Sporothrix schenckii 1099-18 TaxID=1397361 RepID=A0A0F2MA13_SPOSC|nr:uncharacterized protein SPSK_10141 [Sporothrix schenckii 1099-18]KJR85670.1 hypothetical protein SPSK_10141 [Sporothrix schenckii 1099-18]
MSKPGRSDCCGAETCASRSLGLAFCSATGPGPVPNAQFNGRRLGPEGFVSYSFCLRIPQKPQQKWVSLRENARRTKRRTRAPSRFTAAAGCA